MALVGGDLGDNNDNASAHDTSAHASAHTSAHDTSAHDTSAQAPEGRGRRHSRRPHSPAGVPAICWKFSSQKLFISIHNQNINDDELAPIAKVKSTLDNFDNDYDQNLNGDEFSPISTPA